jgi:hypothetical protein
MDDRSKRRLRIFDGLHVSFRMLEHHHAVMYEACVDIRTNQKRVIPALAACWGFIDSLHRLRELSQAIPGLGGRTPELIRFLKTTGMAEDCRHYVQHLREELVSDRSHPVWGSLSWVDSEDPLTSHTVWLGTQLPGQSSTGAVFDRIEGKWASKVCLGIDNLSFNFDSYL